MSKAIMNLTLPLVVAAIEQVLETYPHHPYQQAFANPDLRQELIAYVLTHIHNVYVAVDGEPLDDEMKATPDLAARQTQVESFIHQGIHSTLQQHPALIEHQLPEEDDGYLAASHWFG